jgi:fido (protein-threonine AMPylation protein)
MESALNRIFDRLNRENLLKGFDKDEWMRRATDYSEELRSLHPFFAGNDLAIQEFATELARKNNLQLEWREAPESANDAVAFAEQAERSAQLRRLIMLAVDADPIASITQRHHIPERGNELSLAIREPLI